MALGYRTLAECQQSISSPEFVEWMAFDEFEPIGTRAVPDLLALIAAQQYNLYRKKGARPMLTEDILPDPMAPTRLTEAQEGARTRAIAGDYRRLRAERLAKMAAAEAEG